MSRSLRILLSSTVAALSFVFPGASHAAGGIYHFDGGTSHERTQVRQALAASSFDFGIVPVDIEVHIGKGQDSHSVPGSIWLDADLLDAGRFSWATVQDEFSHQVDFFVLTPAMRARLQAALGSKAWCYENPAVQAHSAQGCERFTSMLPWAFWQSEDNAYRPTSKSDESASMAPAKFRALLGRLLGPAAVRH